MSALSLIAAIDENRGLGKSNQLLCHLPADLKHFKALTLGKPIIMGRKTFESIGRPLPGRLNIVLSRQPRAIEGVTVVPSLDEALRLTVNAPETMIIGGARVFQEALSKAQTLYLTLIHHQFEADVFFPCFDSTRWFCETRVARAKDDLNPYDLTFCRYDYVPSL